MTKPFIMVAPNGARLSKNDHPQIPISIPETIGVAKNCFDAGTDALHLHVRKADGSHSLDSALYREAIEELELQVPQMRVQITTEAVGVFSVAEQLQTLKETHAKWASISVREIARSPEFAPSVYEICAEQGTKVQHILYDEDDAALLTKWINEGIVSEEQNSVLLVLGRYSKDQISDPGSIVSFVQSLPKNSEWMLCAFGPNEHACLIEAARLGGNCRVGFENSRVDQQGNPWQDNRASVIALLKALDENNTLNEFRR